MKLGFIGLGAMGRPMAKRLVEKHTLFVYDVVESAVEDLVQHGAIACVTPALVAKESDITLMSLPNSAIVERVVTGPEGIVAGAGRGHSIIDLSSVEPKLTQRLAKIAEKAGVDYLDAPVSGGSAGAAAGTLTIMLGGKADSVARVIPVLDLIGTKITHVGEVGAGDAVKIVNNLLLGANMAALAEALVLGRKLGLSAAIMADIIGHGSGKSYVLDAKMEKFIMKGNFLPGFAVDLQYKDLGLALEAAKEAKMPLPMTSQAVALFEMARARGYGGEDMSAVIKIWEELQGIQVRQE